MKIKLWTLAWDLDAAGTGASIHQSEHDAKLEAVRLAATDEEELKDGQARVDSVDFWEWFENHLRDNVDTYSVDEQEVDIPAFTSREHASILHGLRMMQEQMEVPQPVKHCIAGVNVCSHFDECLPLNAREIDDLCERINS